MVPAEPAANPPTDYRDRFEALTGQPLRGVPVLPHRNDGGDRLLRAAQSPPTGSGHIMIPDRRSPCLKSNCPPDPSGSACAAIASGSPNLGANGQIQTMMVVQTPGCHDGLRRGPASLQARSLEIS